MVEVVFIGPSECDRERESRERDIDLLWKTLVSTPGFSSPKTQLVLSSAIDLFREALNCYQNGAYMATCAMCRASVEAAIYLALTRIMKNEYEAEVKLDYVRARWDCIWHLAFEKLNLPTELQKEIDKIRERGNFALHYGQRLDKKTSNLKTPKPITLWINREKALETLRKTVRILRIVIGKLHSRTK